MAKSWDEMGLSALNLFIQLIRSHYVLEMADEYMDESWRVYASHIANQAIKLTV